MPINNRVAIQNQLHKKSYDQRNLNTWLYFLILLIFFTGCTGLSPSTNVPTQSASLTLRPTQTPALLPTFTWISTFTSTPRPTRTEEPTPTPTVTLTPGNTPTYNPASMITVTRSPKAVCPVVDPSIQPVFADQVVNGWWQRLDLSGPMVDALNQGAGLPALKRAVSHATYDGKPAGIPPEAIFAKDVTGDGVPEIIFDENWLMIFTCHDGQFREVLKWNSSFTDFVQKPTIADMNLDGLAEIVAPLRFNANYVNEVTFEILRWDGNNFVNLVPEKDMTFNGQIDWSFRDTDRNGTLELVIHNWPSTSPDADVHGPWRYETTALTWNGTNFVQLPTELDPPEYRFQAVQDGDRAMRCCQYLKAVRFFNLAINDPNLKGWGYSIEHFRQRQEAQGDQMEGKPIPTLLPLDPNETPTLKAYAHYRLLLAYVLLHEDKLAETVYQSLQKGHPSEKPGYQYAQLGKMFWEEYEKEHNISAGCAKAIQYTQDNEQLVLEPINNYRMGFQNLSYEVRDICSY